MSSKSLAAKSSPYKRTIIVTRSISHSTISMSKPPQDPIILTLSLCLIDSEEPISICIEDSVFDDTKYGTASNPFCLYDTNTGIRVPANVIQIFRGVISPIIINPDSNRLLTLHPGVPTEIKLRIGLHENVHDHRDRHPDGTTREYLCATSIDDLKPGTRHRIGWCPAGRFGIQFWWWSIGTKETIVKEHVSWKNRMLGRRTFSVVPNNQTVDFRIAMKQEPEILIED